ncbi:MAG: sigma-70 family RNA polymerase sigma factor [Polyangiaceae bacterium]|nr:sigma-70 family RNA polymerase sigma factor [Polyangiaceae bacterium]
MDANENRPAAFDTPESLDRFRRELDLVDLNARQLARQLGDGPFTIDDLRSFGREGLLAAARTFEPERGVPFRRWANLRVRGAMVDGLRQSGSLPRRIYRDLRALAAADAVQEAYDEEGAAQPAPGPEAADGRLTQYLAGLATAIAVGMIASEPLTPGGDSASRQPNPEEALIDVDLAVHLKGIVESLPDAERTLVERHYYGDETLDQAAASLGLSKSWGSRLHARAIDRIARELRRLGVT